MANTEFQKNDIEQNVRDIWLPFRYPALSPFTKRYLLTDNGASYECDAVSNNTEYAGMITTASSKTRSGNTATGSVKKVRLDAQQLSQVQGPTKLEIMCTESSMQSYLRSAQSRGRIPTVSQIDLPDDLRSLLEAAKRTASDEIEYQNG